MNRVVVTGIGVVSAAGCDLQSFWTNVVAGRPMSRFVTKFDTTNLPSKLAAEVRGFDPLRYVSKKKADRFDDSLLFGIGAAREAISDAGVNLEKVDPKRLGVYEGASVTGIGRVVETQTLFLSKGFKGLQPSRMLNAFSGAGSSEVAIELGAQEKALTITSACAAGNDAIIQGVQAIRSGSADVVLAGAAEAPLNSFYYSTFITSGVMTRNNDPVRAMCPFDEDRSGFVMGEGAAYLVLEDLTHALSRGARIYAEWIGGGQASEAYDSVASRPDGRGLTQAIERTLLQSCINRDQIDYINAHGSATQTNELVETNVYKTLFKEHAKRLQISATKPVLGHTMGATAALEAAICCLSLYHRVVPPTPNLQKPYAGCDLDYVPRTARNYPLRTALNVNMGFGGKCSAVLFRRI